MTPLISLEVLCVDRCYKIKIIQGLEQLHNLRGLVLHECIELEEVFGVQHLMWLEWLDARECPKLQWGEGVLEELRRRLEERLYV